MMNMLKDQKAEDMENRDNPLIKLHNEFNNIQTACLFLIEYQRKQEEATNKAQEQGQTQKEASGMYPDLPKTIHEENKAV